jgi:hypothetical protein
LLLTFQQVSQKSALKTISMNRFQAKKSPLREKYGEFVFGVEVENDFKRLKTNIQ